MAASVAQSGFQLIRFKLIGKQLIAAYLLVLKKDTKIVSN